MNKEEEPEKREDLPKKDTDTPSESTNPLDELQKQLQELLQGSNINLGLAPGAGGPKLKTPKKSKEEEAEAKKHEEEILNRIENFNLKPREIRDHLNRYVIKQNEAKKVLSVAICDHYNHVRQCIANPELVEREYNKQNVLILGPTGVGKTYLMRNIARLIGVPFVKADATKFSETGYVGYDVEDLVRDLVKSANGNVDLAQYGIIYIDEIDKIAIRGGDDSRDVSGRGVQINLLKLMEDSEVNLFSPNDMMGQMQAMMDMGRDSGGKPKKKTINTRHILFIVSGAFDKLAERVQQRIASTRIGFGTKVSKDDAEDHYQYLKSAQTRDYIDYGFEPEFIGRLPVRVACSALNTDDLSAILTTSEGSVLKQYQQDFQGYGMTFDVTKEAIEEIAKQAHEERTGARGLMTVLERTFRNYKFELPSTAIQHFEITTETIAEPKEHLKKLLLDNQHKQNDVLKNDLARFAKDFAKEHELELTFDDSACALLISEAIDHDKTIRGVCEEKFKDFQHGLKIVHRNSGKSKFKITKKVVQNPDKELSNWVVKSFEGKDDPAKES